ncbi:MAG: hypothetical protein A2428_16430 [Bdellovibrionales bacterium RIFOXYC1_FULL_54_43]|nr:MAG: hypothetical protein A2428_16430 [Bdellovibrionales bacterium RIFOXYC1_FULL_54_43]OFZ83947.1 MAG: hypothetical protein A2603_10365 [Bdellovibrionales bacterium RIFOXYD1_FULL_55_31]
MTETFENYLIEPQVDLTTAMRRLDANNFKTLFVVDGTRQLLGSLTDGDIRRCILKSGSLGNLVASAYNQKPFSIKVGDDIEPAREIMVREEIHALPVVDENWIVVKVLFRADVLDDPSLPKQPLGLPVVIMAGGKGTRLDPFTRILPKPLIPIGNKAIVEIIIDHLLEYQAEEFFLSLNYKSRMIKSYFEENELPYKIRYVYEEKPMGTAGSLALVKDQLKGPFLLTNCDIIIKADYTAIRNFHERFKSDITMVASLKHFRIPYGVCTLGKDGLLDGMQEKPEFSYLVNTGMYIINAEVLKHVPGDQVFNMTDLIEAVRKNGGRVNVFPISEKSWIDTGEWEEYKRAVRLLDASS